MLSSELLHDFVDKVVEFLKLFNFSAELETWEMCNQMFPTAFSEF